MIKTTYSTMLLVIGFLAVMLMLPSAHLNAGVMDNPSDSPVYSISNINQTNIKGESPFLMAQATEESRSSTSSTNSTAEAPSAGEHGSSASSSSSMKTITTEAPPAGDNGSSASSSSSMKTITAEPPLAAVGHHCAGHCRDRYNESLGECNEPGHPHHRSCEKWARERENECLDKCSRE